MRYPGPKKLIGLGRPTAISYNTSACRPIFLVALVTALCALLLSAVPALAGNGHGFAKSFGGATSTVTDPEPLSEPTGIAWSAKTGEVYVIDAGNDRVERFSSAGVYEGQFTGEASPAKSFSAPDAIVVDNDPSSPSYGDVYVSDSGHNVIDKFAPEGTYVNRLTATSEHSFSELGGVAVDPSGNLWVYESHGLDEFTGAVSNAFVLHQEVGLGVIPGIAVDSRDDVYFIHGFFHNVWSVLPGGELDFFAGFKGCGCVTGVAVDPATDNVYADGGTSFAEYPPFPVEGAEPEQFGAGSLHGGVGIAVSATHVVYVVDPQAGDVDEFAVGPKPAQPTTDEAGTVEGVSAILAGKLEGGQSAYHFAYGASGTCEGAGTTPSVAVMGAETVSVKLTGLTAKTQYTFCLVAENSYGQESSSPATFTTTQSPPIVEETSAGVAEAEVKLAASVNPELEASSCVFRYGRSEIYERETPCETTLGEGSVAVPVTASITGLEPGTTYDYQVFASNATGTEGGGNQMFTTEPITPTQVQTAAAIDVTSTSATIGGQVNPQGGSSYYVEYGLPACSLNGIPNFAWFLCAAKSPEAGPLSGDTVQTVTPIEVTGLVPNTTYRYWLVARNVNGSERGEEATLTTPTATAPPVPSVSPSPPASAVAPAPKPAVVKPPVKKIKTVAHEKAEKLSNALKQCKKATTKARRKTCEAQARKRYGAKPKSKFKSHKRGR